MREIQPRTAEHSDRALARPTFQRSRHTTECMAFAALLSLVACGIETAPGHPKETDSGVNSGSGAGASSGSASGKGGDSGTGGSGDSGTGSGGNPAGKGGSPAGRGGSSGDGGSTAGTAGSQAGASGTDSGSGATGGTSGTGGTGGCTTHLDCPIDHPLCAADGTCNACADDTACTGRTDTPRCNLSGATQGQCVRCLENTDCPTTTPHCNANTCIECGTHDHCLDPTKPQCTAGTCTPCTDSTACTTRTATPHCLTTASTAATGTCVACRDHSDCTDPSAPECGTDHICKPCTTNAACTGRDNATICDTSSDATYGGKCVQCTGTRYEVCGTDPVSTRSFVCDSRARSCSNTATARSTGLCGDCVTDAQCFEGQLCMQQTFGTPAMNAGFYCFWRKNASGSGAPANNCASVAPFVGAKPSQDSIDGESGEVCGLRATTCQGYRDYSNRSCESTQTPGTGDDALCGFAHPTTPDGYCRQDSSSNFLCTLPCNGNQDCKGTSTCNDQVVPNVCTL